MGIIKSNSLHHAAWIMGSDDYQPIVEEIYAGFDEKDNLIISIDHIYYENDSWIQRIIRNYRNFINSLD